MSAVRHDSLIAVVQVRDYLLIVVNKGKGNQRIPFLLQSILSMVSAQKVALCYCFFGRIPCSEYNQKKTKC